MVSGGDRTAQPIMATTSPHKQVSISVMLIQDI
ncbi:MAG: hypothetical protein ACD_39C00683G0001 [uncultured bacterium]|nr:MAG: hypothetical protein ACD_39C00683G0001 [uncultured bacterium]